MKTEKAVRFIALCAFFGVLSCTSFIPKPDYDYTDQGKLYVNHDPAKDWSNEKNKTYGIVVLSRLDSKVPEEAADRMIAQAFNRLDHPLKTVDAKTIKERIRSAGGLALLLKLQSEYAGDGEITTEMIGRIGRLAKCDYLAIVELTEFSHTDTIQDVQIAPANDFEDDVWPAFSISRHQVSGSGGMVLVIADARTGETKLSQDGSSSINYYYDTEDMHSRNKRDIREENSRRYNENVRRKRVVERRKKEEERRRKEEEAERKKSDGEAVAELAFDIIDAFTETDPRMPMINQNIPFESDRYPDKMKMYTEIIENAASGACSDFDAAYDGQTISGNTVDGTGVFEFDDGRRYSGSWKNGKADGTGTYTYSEDTSYKGSFVEGYASGRGVYVDADGNTYDGEYREGLKNGTGVYTVKTAPYLRLDSKGKVYRWKTRHMESGVIPMKDDSGKPFRELEVGNVYEAECLNGVYKRMRPYKGDIKPGS